MANFTATKKGYSLVEVLIAISILMLSIVGPLTIAAKSIQTAQYARQQTTAFFLAQEGVTIINSIRSEYALQAYGGTTDPWEWVNAATTPLVSACFTAVGCGIDFRDSSVTNNDVTCTSAVTNPCILTLDDATTNTTETSLYTHESSGAPTPYTRSIHLTRTGTSEVLVEVEVTWATTYLGGSTQSVVLRTSLFNIYEDL